MQSFNFVMQITSLQRESIVAWKKNGNNHTQKDFLKLVEENHAFNYQLWHAEDRARRDDLGCEFVYHAKREIDHYNQQRNNRMEAIDQWLFNSLQPAPPATCPVHSETPGMIIDRLSILALKTYHMDLEARRMEAGERHCNDSAAKLCILQEQQIQLQTCLAELFTEIKEKTRTFRLYHQFKMYNDPNLNPALYSIP